MSQGFNAGRAIRDLRRQRNLSGEELGKRAGLSQSKISKIETGMIQTAKEGDLEAILNILEAPQTIRQQILTSHTSQTSLPYSLHDRQVFEQVTERERKTGLICTFTSHLFPALIQTGEYRHALLKRLGFTESNMTIPMHTNLIKLPASFRSGN